MEMDAVEAVRPALIGAALMVRGFISLSYSFIDFMNSFSFLTNSLLAHGMKLQACRWMRRRRRHHWSICILILPLLIVIVAF